MKARQGKRRPLRIILALALGGNVLLLADSLLTGRLMPLAVAQEQEAGEVHEEPQPADPGILAAVYQDLMTKLQNRTHELDRRADAVEARERKVQVLLAELALEREAMDAARETVDAVQDASFEHLVRSYENMEPENAAAAMEKLHEKDANAVVDTLLGLGPRKAGAILDAVATRNPGLAAQVSYEILRRGERPTAAPGTPGEG